jgi:hypothetical protein
MFYLFAEQSAGKNPNFPVGPVNLTAQCAPATQPLADEPGRSMPGAYRDGAPPPRPFPPEQHRSPHVRSGGKFRLCKVSLIAPHRGRAAAGHVVSVAVRRGGANGQGLSAREGETLDARRSSPHGGRRTSLAGPLSPFRRKRYNNRWPSADVSDLLHRLSANQREFVTSYYGWSGRPRRSLRRTAAAEGVSPVAIHLRLKNIVHPLRRPAGV